MASLHLPFATPRRLPSPLSTQTHTGRGAGIGRAALPPSPQLRALPLNVLFPVFLPQVNSPTISRQCGTAQRRRLRGRDYRESGPSACGGIRHGAAAEQVDAIGWTGGYELVNQLIEPSLQFGVGPWLVVGATPQ